MKRLLFATTALVASGGIASAQGVEVTGSAEMGIYGGSNIETQFFNDIDVKFILSGESDNGLTFGATIDLDELNGDAIRPEEGGRCRGLGAALEVLLGGGVCPTGENDASVFLSGSFGTITMGDTDGAFDWALQDLDIIADIADANTSHAGFNGNGGLDGTYDGQIARYDYSFGDFAFAVSAELDDTGSLDPTFGIGGKYSGDLGGVTLGVGLGYQSNAADELVGISLDAQLDDGLRTILNYTYFSDPRPDESHLGVGVFYDVDALAVGVNYGVYEQRAGGHISGFGIAANYDLGGGAELQFGYGSSTPPGGPTTDTFSLGVAMTF